MLTRGHGQPGFTLIELMITLVILGILLTQAIPSFISWIQNQQIRNSAESILNGLQLAKAKALRSNTNTELALVASGIDPVPANVGAAASTTGTNWIVRTFQIAGTYGPNDFVQGRAGEEGSQNAVVTADQASFVFTPLGRLLNPPAADVLINVDSATSYDNKRPMRIVVSPGGQIRMCDPNRVDKTNPQFC